MGWDKINKAAAVLGIATFLGSAGTWTWELFTSPDRDVMGSVVSLHALYFGAAVGSTVLALACSWSGVSWAIGFCKRWKDKRIRNSPSGKLRGLHNVVVREFNLTEQDRAYVHDGLSSRSPASKCAQREILRFELSKCGLEAPDPATSSDQRWYEFLAKLMPLSQHGRIDEARALGAMFGKRKGTT